MGGGDVDDAAPAPFLHARQGRVDGVKGAVERDGDDAGEIGEIELVDRRDFLDAGIVDEDVDMTKFGDDGFRQMRAFIIIGEIGGKIDRPLPRHLRHHLQGLRRLLRRLYAMHRDQISRFGETFGDGEPDAAGGTRDEHGFRLILHRPSPSAAAGCGKVRALQDWQVHRHSSPAGHGWYREPRFRKSCPNGCGEWR
ncbi:hypothetical protein D3C78_1035580 [compost metagenome]